LLSSQKANTLVTSIGVSLKPQDVYDFVGIHARALNDASVYALGIHLVRPTYDAAESCLVVGLKHEPSLHGVPGRQFSLLDARAYTYEELDCKRLKPLHVANGLGGVPAEDVNSCEEGLSKCARDTYNMYAADSKKRKATLHVILLIICGVVIIPVPQSLSGDLGQKYGSTPIPVQKWKAGLRKAFESGGSTA